MVKEIGAIILAAGDGERMKSKKSKVCCEVLFKPMINWVIDICHNVGIKDENICVIVSDKENGVIPLLPSNVKTVVQKERKGTGHAVKMAGDFLKSAISQEISQIAVLCGDAPLINFNDMLTSLKLQQQEKTKMTILSASLHEGGDYGRIIRKNGGVFEIKEKKSCNSEELKINEVNSGAYWFETEFLLNSLENIIPNSVTGEYYLTDLVAMAVQDKNGCSGYICGDKNAILGANNRKQLNELNQIARKMVFEKLFEKGVSIPLKDGIIVSPDSVIGENTEILPNTIIKGNCKIGADNVIGPNSYIENSEIGDNNIIEQTKITDSTVANGCKIGPFTQLRPNSHIGDNVKIGNFVEVKNSTVGGKTSLAHLTYIGDSDFGEHINVGCGVVTVNYDGKAKYRTTVEDNAFIGCNSNLIAPVTVKKGAYVAAASTVTDDVDEDALAIGRVRLTVKANGALKYRKK